MNELPGGCGISCGTYPGLPRAVDTAGGLLAYDRCFFPILVEEMEIKKNNIYVNVLEFRNWGYDGEMVAAPKRHDNANQ